MPQMALQPTHEIAPGLWHWTARHPHIGRPVSTYYLIEERVLIDPLMPPRGERWFRDREATPEHILLTNRHHDRHSWRLHEAFGCEVHCVQSGVHELVGRGPVTAFAFGDTLPGGIVAHEVGAIASDETALHIPAHRALAVADGVVRVSGPELEFVPDALMDDPDDTKSVLLERYSDLLALDFTHLLLAHGSPIVDTGREALAEFVSG